MARIYVVGSANVDLNVRTSRLPNPGETLTGMGFDRALGGKGANQAVSSARLGGEVSFVGAVGGDAFGGECLAAYRDEGLDVSMVLQRADVPTGVALISVAEDGANTIILVPGANATLTSEGLDPLVERIRPGDILLLQLEVPLETVERAARIGRERGARVILDPAPAPPGGLPDSIYEGLFALLPNEHEAKVLRPEIEDLEAIANSLRRAGIEHVIVTAGEDGVIWAGEGETTRIPACKAHPVDTVAAGDAFAGGLAVGIAEGTAMHEAIEFGQRAAALSVECAGAQPSMPTRAEVDAFRGR